MLRLGLLFFGLVVTGTGVVLLVRGKCGYQPFLIWGCVLLIAVLCERWRYRRKEHNHDGGQWQPTGERFEDPETGQTVEVHYDPVSGERRYVKK
jgi:membrane protein implicated in regulation of membrane protease activity